MVYIQFYQSKSPDTDFCCCLIRSSKFVGTLVAALFLLQYQSIRQQHNKPTNREYIETTTVFMSLSLSLNKTNSRKLIKFNDVCLSTHTRLFD